MNIEYLAIMLVMIVPSWHIFRRTGMPAALSLLMLIPGLGFLICLYVLAFAAWPNFKTRRYQ